MVTDSGQIVREQWDHLYKEGSNLFRFHISVANIVQSSVSHSEHCKSHCHSDHNKNACGQYTIVVVIVACNVRIPSQ